MLYLFSVSEAGTAFNLDGADFAEGIICDDCSGLASGSTLCHVRLKSAVKDNVTADMNLEAAIIVSDGSIRAVWGEKYVFYNLTEKEEGLYSASSCRLIHTGKMQRIRGSFLDFAERRILAVNRHFRGDDDWIAHNIALKLLLSKKTGDEKVFSDLVQKCGVSHVFALSGMHLAFVVSALSFAFSKICRKRHVKYFCFPFVSLYFFFAGRGASFIRAYIMYAVDLLLPLEGGLLLYTSFIIQLVFSPLSCASAAFDYSYTAVCGIYLFSQFFRFVFNMLFGKTISAYFSLSASAFLFTSFITLRENMPLNLTGILITPVISFLASVMLLCAFVLLLLPSDFIVSALLHFTYIALKKLFEFFAVFSFDAGVAGYAVFALLIFIILLCFMKKYLEVKHEIKNIEMQNVE